jgi:hypothetical protein
MKASIQLAITGLTAWAVSAYASSITVTWGTIPQTGEEMLLASVAGSLVSSSCTNTLTIGSTIIDVVADPEARGTVNVGGKQYSLSDDLCQGYWNARLVQVQCQVPWQGEVGISGSSNSTLQCFPSQGQQEVLLHAGVEPSGNDLDNFLEDMSGNPADPITTGLARRQVTCSWYTATRIADPRNPRKWRRYAQYSVRNILRHTRRNTRLI